MKKQTYERLIKFGSRVYVIRFKFSTYVFVCGLVNTFVLQFLLSSRVIIYSNKNKTI